MDDLFLFGVENVTRSDFGSERKDAFDGKSDSGLASKVSSEPQRDLLSELLKNLSPEDARLHARAVAATESFKKSEAEILEALIEIDAKKVHLHLKIPSLYQYAVTVLGLSESVAYTAVSVSKTAAKVPVLREAVAAGKIGLSKARKVLSVLGESPETQTLWMERAVLLPTRQLEKAVARENPKEAVAERAVYKTGKRVELTLGVSEELLLKFRRAQDQVSRSHAKNESLEETLDAVLEFYLDRKDPERKARRVIAKKGIRGSENDLENESEMNSEGNSEINLEDSSDNSSVNSPLNDSVNRSPIFAPTRP